MSWGQAIDGETPLESRDGLRERSIQNREQLSAAEAKNNFLCTEKYLKSRPRRTSARFDFPWMLKLHRQMFGKVWSWAGTIRHRDLTIGVSWQLVGNELSVLADDLLYWETAWADDVLKQAVYLHHRAVRIHPFLNGNGRWSRMLANVWLKLHDAPIVQWPAQMNVELSPIRQEYIAAIRLADRGDLEPLHEIHSRHC